MALDRNATLPLQVHGIQVLLGQHTLGNCRRRLQQTIGKGRLSMIHMSDDAEVTFMVRVH